MDNDLKLIDINDPVALNQFLELSVNSAYIQPSSHEEISRASHGNFLNLTSDQQEFSASNSSTNLGWSAASSNLLAGLSNAFPSQSTVSASAQNTNSSFPTLSVNYGTAAQNISVGLLPTSNCLPGNFASQNVGAIPTLQNNVNQLIRVTATDNSIHRPTAVNKVLTNFSAGGNAVVLNNNNNNNNSGNSLPHGTGGQVLMNVQPQTVIQNGAVRIQYVQVRNQLPPSAVQSVQNIGAAQLTANSIKPIQLQTQGPQLSHGIQGGVNLQRTVIPAQAGNQIVIRTGNQSAPGVRPGQVNLQPVQICGSNLIGGTQVSGVQPSAGVHPVAAVQPGVRLQQPPQMPVLMGRANALPMSGQTTNLNLSGGRQVVLQRAPGIVGQNVIYQTIPQQQAMTQPNEVVGSQENRLPEGLVFQIGGQMYRFEQSQQPTTSINVSVKPNASFQPTQVVGFTDGSGVTQDPVKMLQQNVQLQQMLIGNQMNVLQMLQQQQQLQPKSSLPESSSSHQGVAPGLPVGTGVVVGGQQLGGSHVGSQAVGSSGMMVVAQHQASGGIVLNSVDVANDSSGIAGSVQSRPVMNVETVQQQQFSIDKSGLGQILQGPGRTLPTPRPTLTTSIASHPGLHFIQPKPMPSISTGPGSLSSRSVAPAPINTFQPASNATGLNTQLLTSNTIPSQLPRPSVGNVVPSQSGSQPNANSGNLQGPQVIHPVVVGGQPVAAGTSQAVTTVQLSAEQQNLLLKIQSQMKALLDLPKRNPDQEKYLQMLISGQQRIIGQGVTQYLQQQQKAAGISGSTNATGSQQAKAIVRSLPGTTVSAEAGAPATSLSVGASSSISAPLSICTSTSSTNASQSSPSTAQNSGSTVKAEELFQAYPHLKDKLLAQLAKMPPEQRQWFIKNQSIVLAKLQHHHRMMMEREKLQQQQQPLQQQPQQLSKLLASPQQTTADANTSAETSATRVIRSLHLTRAQKFHLYLQKDQKRATQPEYSKPFENYKDVIRGLVPYHVFQTREPSTDETAAADESYELKARELLDRRDTMIRKYRHLLLEESMRPQLTSEMVLLERAFLSDEKSVLIEEKRRAEEDPDSFQPRPIIKRLKLEEEDVKKEEDKEALKDEDLGTAEGKTEAWSPEDKEIKVESFSCRSPSEQNTRCRLSSVEQHRSLQIKLEKLDDVDTSAMKYQNVSHDKLDRENSAPDDCVQGSDEDNRNGNESWFESVDSPDNVTYHPDSYETVTESETVVSTILKLRRSNISKHRVHENHLVVENEDCGSQTGTERCRSFDPNDEAGSVGDLANDNFCDLPYAEVADANLICDDVAGNVTDEPQDDELMQGAIDSLMADLTQFNHDLNHDHGNSWSDSKNSTINGMLRRTENSGSSSHYNYLHSTSRHEDLAVTSLQDEMQCAIDSIMQLQKPWADAGSAGLLSTTSSSQCRTGSNVL